MSNTIYNKVTFNNQTLIDLSQDTVTSASHILSGHTGHLADGTQVTGTAVEGVDMPVFTLVIDQDSLTVASATCDRSFAEFKAYMDQASFCSASLWDGNPEFDPSPGYLMVAVLQTMEYIICAFVDGFTPVSDIRYNSDGTITVTSPSSAAQTLTITENGTYQPESDYKSLQEVVVNVPAATPSLQFKSVTPSEAVQTITPDSGYDGLSQVSVGEVSNTYVGSQVPRQVAQTIHPSATAQTISSGRYLTGNQTIEAVTTNLTADKIVSGFTAKIGSASDDDCVASILGTAAGGGTYRRVAICSQRTITPDSSRTSVLTGMTPMVDGAFYIVTYDGIEWICTSETLWSSSYGIGDSNLNWGTSGDFIAPFFIATNISDGESGCVSTDTNQHTLKIEKLEFLAEGVTLIDKTIAANGTYDAEDDNADGYSSVTVNVPSSGSTKNVQYYMGADYTRTTSYGETDVSVTVSKTGTYKVSWMAWRSTSSGTSGSQLYINGTAYGSANTTFTGTYGQAITLTGVSLTQGDVLVVRARARGTSYYMYVGNLIIEETT